MTEQLRLDQLPSGDRLGDLVREAQGCLPSEAALEAALEALGTKTATATAVAGQSVASNALGGAAAKVGVGLAVVALGAAAYIVMEPETAIRPQQDFVSPVATAEADTTIAAPEPPTLGGTDPTESALLLETPPTAEAASEARARPSKRHLPNRRRVRREGRAPLVAPTHESAAPTAVNSAAQITPTETRPTEPPVESEAIYLARAQRTLGTSPALCLRLLERHSALYPGGALGQERDLLRIDALRRLGRHSQATRRVQVFLNRYPNSGHRTRLEAYLDSQIGTNPAP